MVLPRRDFLKAMAVGAVMPVSLFPQPSETDQLYDRAIVIDCLSFEKRDDAGFEAAKRSGYTAIQTSLANRNFDAAVRDLAAWQGRFEHGRIAHLGGGEPCQLD